MRRLLVTAASGAVLLLGAGCSTEPDTTGSAAPVVTATSAAAPATGTPASADGAATATATASAGGDSQGGGDAALANNTQAICASASKAGGAAAVTFAADLKALVDASASKEAGAAAKAQAKVQRDVDQWSFALKDLSQLVADKDVKKALADISKEVGALKGDITKIDTAKVASLQQKLDKACGTA